MTINFTEETFHDIINNSDVPVLVDFWAEWCGPCKVIAPTIDKISTEHSETLLVGKVDIDSNQDLAQQYQVRSIPTLMVFVDGEPQEMIVGAQKASIEEMIGRYI